MTLVDMLGNGAKTVAVPSPASIILGTLLAWQPSPLDPESRQKGKSEGQHNGGGEAWSEQCGEA